METKHTKGQWRTGNVFHEVTTSKPGILESSKEICKLSTFSKTDEEIIANAKLIAEAPKMLDSLIELSDEVEIQCISSNPRLNIMFEKLSNAKSVIKKATE